MKVDNKSGSLVGKNLDTGRTVKSDKTAAQSGINQTSVLNAKTAANKNSNVDMSERGQLMAKAKGIASEPMSVDEAKVARLQKLIDEGKYQTDSNAIAERLLEDHMTIPD